MKQRTPQELVAAVRVLNSMLAIGMELFPLGYQSKMPRDKGFLLHDYRGTNWSQWLRATGNVGVRARHTDLLMDVDPKNGGLESFAMLQWDCEDDFSRYPKVITGRGNGGFHLYMSRPRGRWKWHLKPYPGIDFQGLGRYCVAPGSLHPDTGKPYVLDRPLKGALPDAPAALIEMLRKPDMVFSKNRLGGILSPEKVAELLAYLDPRQFGHGGHFHDEWLDIAMACHEASNGEALEEWLDWCARDDRYGEEARTMNFARWDSFDSRPGGVTYKTLLQAVSRAGHRGAVAGLHSDLEVKEDFPDDAWEYLNAPGDEY